MVKWEYKVYQSEKQVVAGKTVEQNDLDFLNKFGLEGWELVSAYPMSTARMVSGYYYMFKRQNRD